MAAAGLLLAALAASGCSGSTAADVTSSAPTSALPSIPSFSTYLACGAYRNAAQLDAVLQDFLDGTAAQRDLAAPLRDLAVSLGVVDTSMVNEVEGWDPASIEAYQVLSEEVSRFRVRLLDGPKPDAQELRAEVERFIDATMSGAPSQCPDIS